MCLPGCVNGYCETPFECQCETGWTGMFCDKRKYFTDILKNYTDLHIFDVFQLFVRTGANMEPVLYPESASKCFSLF